MQLLQQLLSDSYVYVFESIKYDSVQLIPSSLKPL